MSNIDLRPAADRLAHLVEGIDESQLDGPTPCPDFRLRDLIGHVAGFAMAFRAAATKDFGAAASGRPPVASADLTAGWRPQLSNDLASMAEAWTSPDAWQGMTRAGGIDLPAPVAGRVALDELVVHGWDVARSSGQTFDCDEQSLRELEATVNEFRQGNEGAIPGIWGPVVPVAGNSPLLDKVVGLTGRDPGWSPS